MKSEAEILKHQLAEAMAVNQMMSQELVARSKPTLGQMSDALSAFAAGAEQGNATAKQVLTQFFREFDRARDAASKITIIRGPNGNGPV